MQGSTWVSEDDKGTLTIGKEYTVLEINDIETELKIIDDENHGHYFMLDTLSIYFTIKNNNMKTIEIKSTTGTVLFTHTCENNTVAITVTEAVKCSADLRYADLRYADLRSTDLSFAKLHYADLSFAKLHYADLRYANLSYANLSYTDLHYTNLSYTNLSYADLSYADLSSADLSSADLSSADLRYANLRYADLRSAKLSSAKLSSANLRYADLRYADLRSTDLRYADLRSTDLSFADLSSAKYSENITIANCFFTDGLYKYRCGSIISEDNKHYIKLGCYTRLVSEWEEDFWNNTDEFPNNNSAKSNLRVFAFETCKKWIEINSVKS